jgi:hypothetical protein
VRALRLSSSAAIQAIDLRTETSPGNGPGLVIMPEPLWAGLPTFGLFSWSLIASVSFGPRRSSGSRSPPRNEIAVVPSPLMHHGLGICPFHKVFDSGFTIDPRLAVATQANEDMI